MASTPSVNSNDERSMKIAICFLALSVACVGCNSSIDPTPAPSTAAPLAAQTENTGMDAPDPSWREMTFKDRVVLANVPKISIGSTDGRLIHVSAKNVGKTTLQYYSAGPDHIQIFREIKKAGRWTQSDWDWCGTGKELFEIAPNGSAEFIVNFWDPKKQERILACFSEKDTNRAGLVVLTSDPDE